jgi:hypothetical protein
VGVNLSMSLQTLPTTTIHDESTWIGDKATDNKSPQTTRLVFHNINGLGTTQYRQQISILANDQLSLDIDILGMTEHCLNIHHQDTLKNIQQTLKNSIQDKLFLQMNATRSSTTQRYLPGGTAIMMIGNTIGRLEPKGKGGDYMGRWSYIHMRRKHSTPVTIITAYQVNKNPTNTTGITAWHQQRLILDNEGKYDMHPRTAFINDLTHFILELQQQQHDIIIGGDFNDTIHRHQSGLLKLIMNTGLVDIWNHRHPTHPPFNTYARGSERIDTVVLCTSTLLPHVRKIGYAPFEWFTNSDHRALFLEIDYKQLFREEISTNTLDHAARSIQSNDIKRCKTFVTQFYHHLMLNNAIQQFNAKQDDTATFDDVEKFDKLIGQAGDSAEM